MSPASRRPRVRLFVEEASQVTPIEDWLGWLHKQVTDHVAAIEELTAQSSRTYQELTAMRAELRDVQALVREPARDAADIERRMGESGRRLDELDRRLNKVLALLGDARGGGQSEQGMLHYSYVREYDSLVEQQVLSLAVGVYQGRPGVTARDKALFVARVCGALFGSPQVREQEVVDGLPAGVSAGVIQQAREVCATARALRQKIVQGRPRHWDWEYIPEAEIDPDRQEPWAGSLGEIVDFVVAPAYVVDSDTRLGKQRVFTVARADGDATAAAQDPFRQPPSGENPYPRAEG